MMQAAQVIARWELRNTLRSRWVAGYAGAIAALSVGLFAYGGGMPEQVVVSLLNVVLLVVPLVSLLFGVVSVHTAREFLELLLAQPLRRGELFWGFVLGTVVPVALVVPVGLGIAWGIAARQGWGLYGILALESFLLSGSFAAFGIWFALRWEERLKVFGAAVLLWFALSVLYDGVLLAAAFLLQRYPIERVLFVALLLNPIDLARVAVLLQVDAAALLGYTGALLRQVVGSAWAVPLVVVGSLCWLVVPLWQAARTFARKDF